MEITGKISKINHDLSYGFITRKNGDDVFFSADTVFLDTAFDKLSVDEPVQIEIEQTERGPFASRLTLAQGKPLRNKDKTNTPTSEL